MPHSQLALWELPGVRVYVGVFWWFHHQNTPTSPFCHGDSQRPKNFGIGVGLQASDAEASFEGLFINTSMAFLDRLVVIVVLA